MKNQALFSLKDKSKKLKCCLLHFLFGALKVKKSLKSLMMKLKHGKLLKPRLTEEASAWFVHTGILTSFLEMFWCLSHGMQN